MGSLAKLYNERVCTDPVVAPIIELAVKLRASSCITRDTDMLRCQISRISPTAGTWRSWASLSEARLICAHVGGGGDWEWTIKALYAENALPRHQRQRHR
jgi:hypothetical protein